MIRICCYGDLLTAAWRNVLSPFRRYQPQIFCFGTFSLFCFLIFFLLITISLRTMTPATAATKQSRMRKATQEKHLSVANRSKFGPISIAPYQNIKVTIISYLIFLLRASDKVVNALSNCSLSTALPDEVPWWLLWGKTLWTLPDFAISILPWRIYKINLVCED